MQGIKNVKIHFKLITHAGYHSFCNSIGKFLSRKATAGRNVLVFSYLALRKSTKSETGAWHGPAASQPLVSKIEKSQLDSADRHT